MMPIKTFVSERRAANLLEQVRRHNGVYCPRCRSGSVIRTGSNRQFQRYLCTDCDRTFNDQTGTVVEHSAAALRKWILTVYTYICFNTSFRQLHVEMGVSYKSISWRVQCFLRALDAPSHHLDGVVEIHVKAGLKGHERDQESRSRGLSTRGRGRYEDDRPPVFIIADRGTSKRYVVPAKAADESTIRLLLAVSQQESLTAYTNGFRAYEPLDDDDASTREYIVHGDGKYVAGDIHVNTCESHIGASPKTD